MDFKPTSPINKSNSIPSLKHLDSEDTNKTNPNSGEGLEFFPMVPPSLEKKISSELFPAQDIREFNVTEVQTNPLTVIEYPNNFVYFGEHQDGIPNGFGIAYDKDIQKIWLEGIWQNGVLNGYGKEYLEGELSFEGEWKDGNYKGWGKSFDTNEEIYEGQFSNSVKCGFGTLKSINSNEEKSGYFFGVICHTKDLQPDLEEKRLE